MNKSEHKEILDILNTVICGDCLEIMRSIPDSSIDMVLTSPPYDELRDYKGYSFDFESTAREIKRVLKEGGICVWIVADAVVNGSETGTSFRQALYFKEIGMNIHDTMIWEKDTFSFPNPTRYRHVFEYMFVFSKGSPKTVNLIEDRINKTAGSPVHGTSRGKDGVTFKKSNNNKTDVKEIGVRFNVWKQNNEKNNVYNHPAPFPLKLAEEHVYSWSNVGDIVLDPFLGSGTTALASKNLGRKYIGIDISEEYTKISNERLKQDLLF